MPNRDGPRARTHPAMTAEHERWIQDQQRKVPKAPTTRTTSSGFEASASITSLAVVDGDAVSGSDFTWTALSNCTESGGVLTTSRTGDYLISAHVLVTWASGPANGVTQLTVGNAPAPCTGERSNLLTSNRVSASGLALGSAINVALQFFGITPDDVTLALSIRGYVQESL